MYGLKKVRLGEKVCWISNENKHGWSLGFALGKQTFWLKNVRFATNEEVSRVLRGSNVVFVHLKNPKKKA